MFLIISPDNHTAFGSLNSMLPATVPTWTQGEKRPIRIALADLIASPSGARVMEPRSLSGWSLRVGVGKGFVQPVAGVFTLTFGGDTTTNLDYNATAEEIEDALNALASVTTAGGVTVTGQDGFFLVTFSVAGARAEITGSGSNLAPLSIIDIGTLVDGSGSLQEVQTVRIFQNPGAYTALTVESDEAAAVVSELQAGGGGFNAKYRVRLTPSPYDGKFSIIVDGEETELIDYNAGGSTVQLALEALASVGTGNVSAFKESEGSYLIGFKGDLADTVVVLGADGSTLLVAPTLSDAIDLRNSAIDLILGDDLATSIIFEVEGTDPDGNIQKLYRNEGTLISSIIGPSSDTPPEGLTWIDLATGDARYISRSSPQTVTWPSGRTVTMATGSTLVVNGAVTGGSTSAWDLSAISIMLPVIVDNVQTADYTLLLSDAGKYVRMNKGTAVNLTVPSSVMAAIPIRSQVLIDNMGAGQVTIVESAGVVVNTPQTLKLRTQHSHATLIKVGTNEWNLVGDLESA